MNSESMNCSLNFEHFCKHCGEWTFFCVVSIPNNLTEEYIEHYIQHSSNDCCYKCYMLRESVQDQALKLQTEKINKKG